MIRSHHGKQKGRDLTHCWGCSRKMLRTNSHKKETEKMAQRNGDWKLRKSSSKEQAEWDAWLGFHPAQWQ